jgi:LPXTG-motif cell wall-anchored protein
MLMAAMLAMVLAAAAPALGQQIGGDQGPVAGDDAVQAGDNVQYAAVCQDIIGALDAAANQYGFSDTAAFAEENAAAVSEIAQDQNVSVSQVNECLNAFFASASPTATAGGGSGGGGAASAAAGSTLPSTGGFVPSSALALGAGALLVAGGLLARKIVR